MIDIIDLCKDCVFDGHAEKFVQDALRSGGRGLTIEFAASSMFCTCSCHGERR